MNPISSFVTRSSSKKYMMFCAVISTNQLDFYSLFISTNRSMIDLCMYVLQFHKINMTWTESSKWQKSWLLILILHLREEELVDFIENDLTVPSVHFCRTQTTSIRFWMMVLASFRAHFFRIGSSVPLPILIIGFHCLLLFPARQRQWCMSFFFEKKKKPLLQHRI
jgi:hypothetical protein